MSSKLSLFVSAVCAGMLLVSGRPTTQLGGNVQCEGDCTMIFRDCFFGCDQTAAGDIGVRTDTCNAFCKPIEKKCLGDCARMNPGVAQQEALQVGAIPFTCDWDYENCMSTYQQTHSEFTKKYCMDHYQSCKDSVSSKMGVAAVALTGACDSGCESIYHSGVAQCRSSCASNADAQGCTTGCIQRRYNEMSDCKRRCKVSSSSSATAPSSPRLGLLYPCRGACADKEEPCRQDCKFKERTPAGVEVCQGECLAAFYKCSNACHEDGVGLKSPKKSQVAGPACIAGCKLTGDAAKVACKLQRRQHRQRCEENVAKVEKDCELACVVIPTTQVAFTSSMDSCKDDCQYDYDVCLRGCALKSGSQERRDCKVDCMQTMDVDTCVSFKCRK